MKKCLLFLLLLLTSISGWAYDAMIDGIYYNLNLITKTAEVTYETEVPPYYYEYGLIEEYRPPYRGEIIIPEKITYDGETYVVTSIGYDAFYRCSDLTSISIPESVDHIGGGAFNKCI